MTKDTKYGKCIHTTDLIRDIPDYGVKSILAHDGELDADLSIGYHCIAKPMSFDVPHSHKFPEMLCFIGGNPLDITDLGAEIEFTLGREKHLITGPAVVSIPPGVKHCPVIIKKVKKPLVFLEISLTRIWKPYRKPAARKPAATAKKTPLKTPQKPPAKRSK